MYSYELAAFVCAFSSPHTRTSNVREGRASKRVEQRRSNFSISRTYGCSVLSFGREDKSRLRVRFMGCCINSTSKRTDRHGTNCEEMRRDLYCSFVIYTLTRLNVFSGAFMIDVCDFGKINWLRAR